jgi:CDP-glucose 4,6-dehydratase
VINTNFWQNKNIFLTGHTGFKGSWLTLWLEQLGANITGYALPPDTNPAMFNILQIDKHVKNNIYGDICNEQQLSQAMQEAQPEIVIHLAAQSLVRESYTNPVETYATNVMGVVNLLQAAKKTSSVKVVLNITTDKIYENKERLQGYTENEPLGGYDPYSSSKACSELVSASYRQSFFQQTDTQLATARAGNVVGGGDWAADRLVPDAIRAFTHGNTLTIRNPLATRPWQHVLEPLGGYLLLCEKMYHHPDDYAQAWNFGPVTDEVETVKTLADSLVKMWQDNACWQQDHAHHPHEANALRLNCSKALTILNWKPIWNLQQTLQETINWYKAYYNQHDMLQFTLQQIQSYEKEIAT